jgi:hypothetical protein
MSRKPVSIKAARKKKQVNPLHKPLSYWQELLPGWTGQEYCNQYCTINLPEGNDWEPAPPTAVPERSVTFLPVVA